jgi:hypothetical protein
MTSALNDIHTSWRVYYGGLRGLQFSRRQPDMARGRSRITLAFSNSMCRNSTSSRRAQPHYRYHT